jgi:hypothetical protein
VNTDPLSPSDPSDGDSGVPLNRKATYSIVFGIAAFACLYVFPFGALALGVPSITTGVHARREIAESHGHEAGDGLAVSGLLVGGMALATFLVSGIIGTVFG